jgi:hypothetical protein
MKPISRRESLRLGTAAVLASAAGHARAAEPPPDPPDPDGPPRPYLTPGERFTDVSRGKPVPHSLTGEDLVKARLTPETWRLEVATEGKAQAARPLRADDGTAVDLAALRKLGESKGVMFLKAMQ